MGTLGVLIPPSVILIIFGIITQQSIGKLFMAAFYAQHDDCCNLYGYHNCVVQDQSFSWTQQVKNILGKQELRLSRRSCGPHVIFVVMVAGLMSGIFTPTEAGSVGALSVLILTLIQKDLNFKKFKKAIARVVAVILHGPLDCCRFYSSWTLHSGDKHTDGCCRLGCRAFRSIAVLSWV